MSGSEMAGRLRWPLWGIFLLLAIFALAYARSFLMPVVLAMLLALVFAPLRRFFERLRVPTGLAALGIVTALIVAAGVLVASVAVPASEWIDDAPQILRKVEDRLREIRPATDRLREIGKEIGDLVKSPTEDASRESMPAEATGAVEAAQDITGDGKGDTIVVEGGGDKMGTLGSTLSLAPAMIAQLVFTLILLFFLLASGDMFLEKIVHAAQTRSDKQRAVKIVFDIERKLSRYLFTITVINAGLGLAIGLGMWAMGMPNPLLFGVIGFLFNFAPYVGAIAGTVIATAVGIVSLETLGAGLGAGALYFALTSIEGQLVTPWFVGRNLRLNTVVVFLSVMFWAWLWSAVGILVATPLLVSIRVLCDHIPALAAVGRFLSDRDAPQPGDMPLRG